MPISPSSHLKGAPRTANEELLNRAIRHALLLRRFTKAEVRQILAFMNDDVLPDVVGRLQARLERAKMRGFDGGAHTTQRYRDMVEGVNEIIRTGISEAGKKLSADMKAFALTEAEWQRAAVKQSTPVDLEFTMPDAQTLRSIVSSRPMQGAVLSDWFDKAGADLARRVERQIGMGIAQGESIDAIVRRVRGTEATGYTDGVLQGARRNVESIVRTAVRHVGAHAREATFEENADVIEAVQYVATLDTRTTPICRSLDGKVFPIGEGPRPPQHFGCRSDVVPVLKSWKQLGIDLKEAPEGTRASMNGQVPESVTYEGWLSKQDKAVQDEALGPRRAELWRSGQLTMAAMVGAEGQPLTLAQLAKKEGLPVPAVVVPTPAATAPPRAPTAEELLIAQLPPGTKVVDGMLEIGGQMGSNPGGLYQAQETGQKLYVKASGDVERVRNELLAAALYRQADGFSVPAVRPAVLKGKAGVASNWIDGARTFDKLTPAERETLKVEARKNFAVDAWLANWDAAGLSLDNIVMTPGGQVVRIDVGGSLRYRAQGKPKGSAFGSTVGEIDSLRSSSINPSAAKLFGDMSDSEILASIERVRAVHPSSIDGLLKTFGPTDAGERESLRDTLLARREYLLGYADKLKVEMARKADAAAAQAAAKIAAEQAAAGRKREVLDKESEEYQRQYKAWIDSMKPEHHNAVSMWTTSGYIGIREWQRGRRVPPSVEKLARDFEEAIAAAPVARVKTLYRGMSLNIKDLESIRAGGVIRNDATSSFSSSKAKALTFGSGGGDDRHVLIKLRNGSVVPIEKLSAYKTEKEHLAARGQHWRVIRIEETTRRIRGLVGRELAVTVIEVEEI